MLNESAKLLILKTVWVHGSWADAKALGDLIPKMQALKLLIAQKAVPYTVNSHALTGEKPCINKGFSRAVEAQNINIQYDRTGPTKIIPPYTL